MDQYVVEVVVEIPATPLEIMAIIDRLVDAGASVARVDSEARLEALTIVEGDGIEHAIAMAIWRINSIALGRVVAIAARTEAEHHRHIGHGRR